MKDYEKVITACKRCINSVGCDGCPYHEMEDGCAQFKRDTIAVLEELQSQLEQPGPIEAKTIHRYDEQICKLNDELYKVGIEYERAQRELAEAERELAYLRAVKTTAEAFLGRKING